VNNARCSISRSRSPASGRPENAWSASAPPAIENARELLAGGEGAVDRGPAHLGGPGHLLERDIVPALGEDPASRGEKSLPVACRITALGRHDRTVPATRFHP